MSEQKTNLTANTRISAFNINSPGKVVGVAFLLSYLIVIALCPEIFLLKTSSLMFVQDKEIPIQNLFTLISNALHGGIQLWDRYDQMEYAYAHLTGGLYTLVNVVLAAGFLLLTPFLQHPGEFLYSWHIWGFFGLTILLRTVGGYLLLRRFTQEPFVIIVSLIIFNTFLSSLMYRGFFPNNLYSYFPLLIYFIMRFFDEWQLKHFCCAVVVMIICVANSALFALAYFYEVVHMFLLGAVALTLIAPERRRRFWLSFSALPKAFNKDNILRAILAAGVCAVIMLPVIMMAQSLTHDFYIAQSGLGGTEGRIKNAFSVSRYFAAEGRTYLDPGQFWLGALYHVQNLSGSFWMFTGASVFLLSIIGLVMVKNSWKHVFLWTIIAIIFLNDHAVINHWSSFAHWLTVLTNPFSFLLRSDHMSAILMYYALLPLVALGLQACWELFTEKIEIADVRRVPWLKLILLALMVFFVYKLLFVMRLYVLSCMVIVLAFLYFFGDPGQRSPYALLQTAVRRRVVAFGLFALLAFIDIKVFAHYIAADDYIDRFIVPITYTGLEKAGPVVLDFQNPTVFPFREYYRADQSWLQPPRYTQQNTYGFFYGYMPMARFFLPDNLYQPKHIAYKGLNADQDAQKYLMKDESWITFSPTENNEPSISPRRVLNFEFDFQKAKRTQRANFDEYEFSLPKGFPEYEATTVFTLDEGRYVLSLNGRVFKPVQGRPTEAYRYDIANYSKKRLTVSVPKGFSSGSSKAQLRVSLPKHVENIWLNQNDAIGMNVRLLQDGWMVIKSPFTPKWELRVDGKKVPIIKSNGYFMAAPVTAGEHKILLRYWPNSPLRFLIGLSVIVSILALGAVIKSAWKEECLE